MASVAAHRSIWLPHPDLPLRRTICPYPPSSATHPSPSRSLRPPPLLASSAPAPTPEFGARDPFDAEIASNFADKVLGLPDTEHIILVPPSPALTLAERSCIHPLPSDVTAFSLDEAKALLRKIVGWRLIEEESGLKLQCDWKLKDHAAGLELKRRLTQVSESERKPLDIFLDDQTHILRAEIWTHSIGGLCENDFILAAKIDRIPVSDLRKKNKFWA